MAFIWCRSSDTKSSIDEIPNICLTLSFPPPFFSWIFTFDTRDSRQIASLILKTRINKVHSKRYIYGIYTVFEEEIGALEEEIVDDARILVGKKGQNGRPVKRDPTTGRDLAAVTTTKWRMDQIHRLRVGNLCIEVDVFVTAPIIIQKEKKKEKKRNDQLWM